MTSATVIVAVARVDYDVVHRQIAVLRPQLELLDATLIVSDNSGEFIFDESLDSSKITVVNSSDGLGAAHARNLASRLTTAEHLLFCDADDIVAPDWIARHLDALKSAPLVAGTFLDVSPDDPVIDAAVQGSWPEHSFAEAIKRHEGLPFATSANMSVRRNVFDAAGGFPERYLRAQDVAFSLRCRQLGHSPLFLTNCRVLKVDSQSSTRVVLRNGYRFGRSRVMLRHDFRVGPSVPTLLVRSMLRLIRDVARLASRHPDRDARKLLYDAAGVGGQLAQSFPWNWFK